MNLLKMFINGMKEGWKNPYDLIFVSKSDGMKELRYPLPIRWQEEDRVYDKGVSVGQKARIIMRPFW